MARSFAFHACLGPATRQADVLRVCGLTQLLDAALAGFHVTIMTYGQTGSGKTFTMSGREERLEMDDYVGATHNLSPSCPFHCLTTWQSRVPVLMLCYCQGSSPPHRSAARHALDSCGKTSTMHETGSG